MATETPQQLLEKAQAAAQAARLSAQQAQVFADQLATAAGAAAHAASGGSIDPFVFRLAIFVLAVFVGYYVVWSVTPALHTPLMSVTNAISSVIVVGALLSVGVGSTPGDSGPIWARALGFFALILASVNIFGVLISKGAGAIAAGLAAVNIFGGFLVTQRMLAMYKKKG